MRHRRRQSGFVLLMVLVLVLLAGAALSHLAWRSLTGAIQSGEQVEELQRRWAAKSLQATLLDRVEELLDDAERGPIAEGAAGQVQPYANKPIPELRVTCRLAEIDYDLVLTDEQAKLNVNSALKARGRQEAESAVSRLVAQADTGMDPTVEVKLRPLAYARSFSQPGRPFLPVGSYGQVFEGTLPHQLIGSRPSSGLAAAITCWGDGRVSLRRAPATVIEQACRKELGRDVVATLLAARQRDPYRSLAATLDELPQINDQSKTKVRGCLTDESSCHGLWVIARGRRRCWYSLAVAVGAGPGRERTGVAAERAEPHGPSATGPASAPATASADKPPRAAAQCYEFTW